MDSLLRLAIWRWRARLIELPPDAVRQMKPASGYRQTMPLRSLLATPRANRVLPFATVRSTVDGNPG